MCDCVSHTVFQAGELQEEYVSISSCCSVLFVTKWEIQTAAWKVLNSINGYLLLFGIKTANLLAHYQNNLSPTTIMKSKGDSTKYW